MDFVTVNDFQGIKKGEIIKPIREGSEVYIHHIKNKFLESKIKFTLENLMENPSFEEVSNIECTVSMLSESQKEEESNKEYKWRLELDIKCTKEECKFIQQELSNIVKVLRTQNK